MLMSLMGLWAFALAQFAAHSAHPAELLAGATVVVAALLAVAVAVHLVVAGPRGADESTRTGATLRERARRRSLPRLLDPDAAGRPRPRAPAPGRVHPVPAV
ncbi:DUF6412 domain-containing protein [Polymorphospora sp. NPDC051019]|uniref:DUF6412 domain-containing protein n=1 Tax=Polymorphospora sp. NPDC051019 TaxID=3155725 RepID=UPI0034132FFA